MAAKSIEYAEQKLGVHTIYSDAKKALEWYGSASADYERFIDEKRRRLASVEDIEIRIISEERANNPEMSQAQMDRHLKIVFNQNGDLRLGRDMVIECSHSIDVAEHNMKLHEKELQVLTARMNELGGYLQYLAAVKQNTPETPQEAST